MRSRITLILLLLSAAFAITYNAQAQITAYTASDTCGKGFFYITHSFTSTYSKTSYFGDGSSVNWPHNQLSVTHQYSLPGTYTVKHVLKNNGVPIDSVQSSFTTSTCQYARVNLFLDANNNCVEDAGEQAIAGSFKVEIDSAGVKLDTIMLHSSCYARLTPGSTYTLKLMPHPSYTGITTCPSAGTITVTMPSSFSQYVVDFGLQVNNTQFDLYSGVTTYYRPVNYSYLHIFSGNAKFAPTTGTISATFNSKYNFYAASPTPLSVTGNVVTWSAETFTSFKNKSRTIVLVPGTNPITVGDTICANTNITPTTGDLVPGNNYLNFCDTVRSGFDPNSKEVIPAGGIMPGTRLEYTINFENLGNDTAFNIHVLDTLSDYLNHNSFEMLYASHRVMPSLLKGSNGKQILKFDFADIKLADSSHPESNKGFVKFTMNVKTGLQPMTQIENRAGIYFDINPVVMTNSAINWISPVSVKEVVAAKGYSIYPNPNDGEFVVKTNKGDYSTARVVNNLGQVLRTQQLTGAETKIDIKAMPTGIYYIVLQGAKGTAAEMVEKR